MERKGQNEILSGDPVNSRRWAEQSRVLSAPRGGTSCGCWRGCSLVITLPAKNQDGRPLADDHPYSSCPAGEVSVGLRLPLLRSLHPQQHPLGELISPCCLQATLLLPGLVLPSVPRPTAASTPSYVLDPPTRLSRGVSQQTAVTLGLPHV